MAFEPGLSRDVRFAFLAGSEERGEGAGMGAALTDADVEMNLSCHPFNKYLFSSYAVPTLE